MPTAATVSDVEIQPGTIVAAVTFDEPGRQCLREALMRAAATGRQVIALHILHETERTLGLYRRHDHGEVLRPNLDVARRLLADFSAEVVSGVPDADRVLLRPLVVEGVPEGRIAEVAKLTGADLIIVGGPLAKPPLDQLLGRNVARSVVRHAPCAVVVVDVDGHATEAPGLHATRRERSLPPAIETH